MQEQSRSAPVVVLLMMCLLSGPAIGQELAPRAYWPAPNGTNVLVTAYQYSSGDIVTDPSLPVTGVESKLNLLQLSYQRTLSLFGRSANAQLSLPFSTGTSEGFFNGDFVSADPTGFADVRGRLSVNLRGAPSLDGAAFQKVVADPPTIVGASLLIQAPTGRYDPDKLLNTGTNRWAVKPAIGVIWPVHPSWLIEAELGVWIYEDNDEFLGATREQEPIFSSEFHLIKLMPSGLWVALDMNYYTGGQTTVGGERRADLQRNSRLGFTLFRPFRKRHAIRGSFSTGFVTESGGDFETYSLSYVYAW
jgi:hypothetical protein